MINKLEELWRTNPQACLQVCTSYLTVIHFLLDRHTLAVTLPQACLQDVLTADGELTVTLPH